MLALFALPPAFQLVTPDDNDRPSLLEPELVRGAGVWDGGDVVRLSPTRGEARTLSWPSEPHAPLVVGADRGGRFHVEVRAPDGYAPVEPFEVGRTTPARVLLERRF